VKERHWPTRNVFADFVKLAWFAADTDLLLLVLMHCVLTVMLVWMKNSGLPWSSFLLWQFFLSYKWFVMFSFLVKTSSQATKLLMANTKFWQVAFFKGYIHFQRNSWRCLSFLLISLFGVKTFCKEILQVQEASHKSTSKMCFIGKFSFEKFFWYYCMKTFDLINTWAQGVVGLYR